MKVRFGFDDKTHGEAESLPDGTLSFSGPRADSVETTVRFYGEQFARGFKDGDPEPTPDDLLRYIVGRMHGRSWAVDVTHGEPKPEGPV